MFLFFHRFHDEDTENAIARGENVTLFGGVPTGELAWGNKFLTNTKLTYPWYYNKLKRERLHKEAKRNERS